VLLLINLVRFIPSPLLFLTSSVGFTSFLSSFSSTYFSSLVFPLPRSPCGFLCWEMVRTCKDQLPSSVLPDCEELSDTEVPLYPNKSTSYRVKESIYNVECNHEVEEVGETTACPKPLKLRTIRLGRTPCRFGCRPPIWTSDQWYFLNLQTIFGSITLVSTCWLIVCWLSQEKLRRFPANLTFFPACGSALRHVLGDSGNSRTWKDQVRLSYFSRTPPSFSRVYHTHLF
jgi:hypothetical protein